jgi:uncharacterized membrane protein
MRVYAPAQLAIATTWVLNLVLVAETLIPARWVFMGLEAALLVALVATTPPDARQESELHRHLTVGMMALLAVANNVALLQLAHFLVTGGDTLGRTLILSGSVVWTTNIVLFGLAFWRVDGGGPRGRALAENPSPDFNFPQTAGGGVSDLRWRPEFFDYLYVSFTNSTTFGPADTVPMSRRAKGLMLLEALASFLTVGLIVSYAVSSLV